MKDICSDLLSGLHSASTGDPRDPDSAWDGRSETSTSSAAKEPDSRCAFWSIAWKDEYGYLDN